MLMSTLAAVVFSFVFTTSAKAEVPVPTKSNVGIRVKGTQNSNLEIRVKDAPKSNLEIRTDFGHPRKSSRIEPRYKPEKNKVINFYKFITFKTL